MRRELPVPPLTPPDLPRAARGYQRKATDDYIDELAVLYEAVWLERKRLLDDIAALERQVGGRHALEAEVERLRAALDARAKPERSISGAIATADRFADAMKEEARRNAEVTLKKARERAEEIVAEARRERRRFDNEAHRLAEVAQRMRSDLMSTLAAVLDDLEGRKSRGDEAAPRSEYEPAEDATGGAGPGRQFDRDVGR